MLFAACLIVRDGADTLARCLRSVAPLVEEIVVYDTGSTDDSVSIAEAAGAVVVRGDWNDDFAAARNAALAAVGAEWVLSIDADEFAEAPDPSRLRAHVAGLSARVGVAGVQRHDLMPTSTGSYEFFTPRLFRRRGAQWTGRVHESVEVRDDDGVPAASTTLPPALLRLAHDGYADPEQARAKARRNARIGVAEMEQLRADPGTAPERLARCLLDLGRSLVACDDLASAVRAFDTVRLLVDGDDHWARATDHLARTSMALGAFDRAQELSDELRSWGAESDYCDWLLAQALAQSGEPQRAAELLAGLDAVTDVGGRRYDPALVAEFRDLTDTLVAVTSPSA